MKVIDLNIDRQFEELFRQVEAGEVLHIMRGEQEIATVWPAPSPAEQEEMDAWAAEGLRQLTETSIPGEFDDWKQPDGTR